MPQAPDLKVYRATHCAFRPAIGLMLLVTLVVSWTAAQEVQGIESRIVDEVTSHNEIEKNLRFITNMIGPRLTGTDAQLRASEWSAERLRDYGLANVHLEGFKIAHAWKRGAVRAHIVKPAEVPILLRAEAAGWSPNTTGMVRGRIVYFPAKTQQEIHVFHGDLRNAIVITERPHRTRSLQDKLKEERNSLPEDTEANLQLKRDEFLKAEGALAILRDSDKQFGLFDMNYAGFAFQPGPLPEAYLTPESYDMIWDLLQYGGVEVELSIEGCTFSEMPVEVFNTVGDIVGAEHSDEMVILAAHIDSWDLGTGAMDNGTGVAAVLEAARALKNLKIASKRTIRFVLFTGEEEGMFGAKAYVEKHRKELTNISAVLVHDDGTGRVDTISLQGNGAIFDVLTKALSPLRDTLALDVLSMRGGEGSDHDVFNAMGVPAFFCQQQPESYDLLHHSQADTFDKAIPANLIQGAQVLAAFAFRVAEMDRLLPRPKLSTQ